MAKKTRRKPSRKPVRGAKKTERRPRPKVAKKATRRGRPSRPAGPRYGGISSSAVERATGRDWDEWLKVLDADGAREMAHKAIAGIVAAKHRVGDWWSQMVTVGYEQARGLREKHQTDEGYQVSATRTIPCAVDHAFKAWKNPFIRQKWLPGKELTIRKATPAKSIRARWNQGYESHINVNFYSKGAAKCSVQLDHRKIKTRDEADKLKAFWQGRFGELLRILDA